MIEYTKENVVEVLKIMADGAKNTAQIMEVLKENNNKFYCEGSGYAFSIAIRLLTDEKYFQDAADLYDITAAE